MVGNEENYSSAVEENSDMSSRKMNIPHPRLAAMGIAIIIIALITIGIYQLLPVSNASAGKVSISATKSGSNGVNTASWFKINLEKPIDQKAVTNSLKIFPAFSYTLKKKDGGREYQIIPRHQLAANTIYKFSFDQTGKGQENLSWAFQTTGEFCLISTLPHNETVGVPVNTGIEFIFSHDNFDLDQARKMVEISPRTEGRFEKHKRTLVFIPKALKPATLYTVTLKKGWGAINSRKSISKDEIFRFETASKTVSEQEFIFYLNNRMAEFTTRQIPTFPISFGTGASVPRPQVDVFRYTDAESYGAALENLQAIPYWCTNSESQFLEDTKGLTRVVSFETSFNPASRYQYFIAMPDKIPAGYYLLNIKAGNQVRQAVFQVSDLAVYRAQSQKQTLLWVNDVMTKLPVTGIEVWSGDKKLVSGDDSGVVLINHDLSSPTAGYVVVKAGTRELLVPLEQETSFNNQGFLVSQGYWKYLYLDRELYLPGDTVHFFGVLSPRQGSTVPKGDLTLELWGGDYYYSEERTAEPLYTQKLNPQGNTFSGKYQLPVLKPGYYYLEVKLGKASLTSRGFTVATYQKPAYQVTVTPDKKAILVGEKINYRVKSTFFEGTAVPGLSLNYYLNNREGKVVTNIQGEANISYTGQYADDNYAPYNYEYFNVNASTPESGDIGDYNGVIVFPGSVTVRADAVTKSDKFELTARLNRIDLSQIEAGGYVSEDNYIKSPVSHGKIQARLFKEAWIRTQSGETYDYINKQVLPIYDYSYHTQLVKSIELVTDGQGVAKYNGTLDQGYSYYVELTSPDEQGRLGRARVYVGEFYDDLYSYNYYSLKDNKGKSYLPGEKVNLEFMRNTRQLDPQGKNILFFRGQNKIETYQVTKIPQYQFVYSDKDLPNTNIYGVFFDGESYQETNNYIAAFDYQSRDLKVSVKTDKKEYRPGDTVKMSLLVKDPTGQEVKNAHLNLNLVDEALYRLMDQRVDILGSLYRDYVYPVLYTWKSHFHPQLGGGAEQGGEGAGERRDFRDTVLFKDLVTDGKGEANVEFKLPDNLTSWRITYHAVTSDLMVTSGTSQIPVRLPFFINANINSVYRTGDAPIIILRSYGNGLKPGARVNYQVTLTSPRGTKQNYNVSGTAFAAQDIALPVLEDGKYSIRIQAQTGGKKDALVQSFKVIKNTIRRTIAEPHMLQAGMQIKGSELEPTTLIFSDYEKNQYLTGLFNLSGLNGSRVEHRVASLGAQKLLKRYFPDIKTGSLVDQTNILQYQQPDGGISILPYAASDLGVTARIAAVAPEYFDRRAMTGYFYRLLDENRLTDQSLLWLGLASLDEPVLLQVKEALKKEKISPAEQINLSLALMEMGDGAYAASLYRQLLDKYGQDLGAALRINVGNNQDDIIEATTQMTLLAFRLHQPEKQQLLTYLLENPGDETVNSLELLQIEEYGLRYMDTKPVSFSYQLHGKTMQCVLKDKETYKLTILPGDLAELKIDQIKGKVGMVVYYSVPVSDKSTSDDLKIQRSYYVNNQPKVSFMGTDLVKVQISTLVADQAPGGSYEVIDVLPSGLVYLPRPYSPAAERNAYAVWPTEVNGQQLTFVVPKGQGTIIYYARVVSPGKFTAEAPLLQHCQNSRVLLRGAEQKINIQ